MSQTTSSLPASQLIISQLLQGTLPSNIFNTQYCNSTTQSDPPINMEFSTEQLELTPNPDYEFMPPWFFSQNSKSSLGSNSLLVPQEGPLSINTPTSSQYEARLNDWRANDPDMVTQSTDPGMYKPEPVHLVMGPSILTPQATPPRSPVDFDFLVVNSQPQEADDLPTVEDPVLNRDRIDRLIDDIDFTALDEFTLLQSLPDADSSSGPSQVRDADTPNSSEGGSDFSDVGIEDVKQDSDSGNEVAVESFEKQVEPVVKPEAREYPSAERDVVEPVKPPKASPVKSGRGRKRKAVAQDREERKREQNAVAAKKYRERLQEKTQQIFDEKKQLEETVAALRRKVQSRMDERNIMLFMFYELAKDKQSLDKFIFPTWVEPLYKKHKEGHES